MAKTKVGHNAHRQHPLSDTKVKEIYNQDVQPICEEIEPFPYGLHSLRSGGASDAINSGTSERLIGKHGHWKSKFSRDRYLKDGKTQKLTIKKPLGL